MILYMNRSYLFEKDDMVEVTKEEIKQLQILLYEANNRLEYEKLKKLNNDNSWWNWLLYWIGY